MSEMTSSREVQGYLIEGWYASVDGGKQSEPKSHKIELIEVERVTFGKGWALI